MSLCTGPLCNEELLKIARSLGARTDWRHLAYSLSLQEYHADSIERAYPLEERTYATLRDWRMKSFKLVPPSQSVAALYGALCSLGRDDLGDYVLRKFEEAGTCA